MTKVINATLRHGAVSTADGVEIPDVELLVAGERESNGVVVIDSNAARYFAIPVDDIAELVELLKSTVSAAVLLANTPAAVGATPASANPDLLPTLQEVQEKLKGFLLT